MMMCTSNSANFNENHFIKYRAFPKNILKFLVSGRNDILIPADLIEEEFFHFTYGEGGQYFRDNLKFKDTLFQFSEKIRTNVLDKYHVSPNQFSFDNL